MTNFPSDVLPVLATFFQLASWFLPCLGLLCPEIVCNLQMMAAHCFIACVAIICIVAVTCHLWPLFVCSSSCFLVHSLVPFCVLFGVLPRAILRAPACAWTLEVPNWSSQNGARTNSPLHMQVLWLNCLALAGREQLGRATPETAKMALCREDCG